MQHRASSCSEVWPWGVLVTLFLYSCIHPSATPENHPILSSLFRCAGLRQATKQLSIRRLPPLLAVHIKRFEHHRRGGGGGGRGGGGTGGREASPGGASGGGGATAAAAGGGGSGGGRWGNSGPGPGGLGSAAAGGGVTRKLQVPISFPTGQLDMTPYTSGSTKALKGAMGLGVQRMSAD